MKTPRWICLIFVPFDLPCRASLSALCSYLRVTSVTVSSSPALLPPPSCSLQMAALLYLVREVIPSNQLTLVFAATRHHVDYIAALMAREGIPVAYAYGTRDQVCDILCALLCVMVLCMRHSSCVVSIICCGCVSLRVCMLCQCYHGALV